MTASVDTFVFAPLATIIGVILFWFIQLLLIDSYKYLLSKIWQKHEPFCKFTNFIGVLFQTICHALGFTITRSGIQHFHITVDYGKVKPKKEKKGIFEWIANAFLVVGPFFIPALIILLCLFILLPEAFALQTGAYETFAEGLIHFGQNLHTFSVQLLGLLASIDLAHPVQFGFLFLLIFLGLGIRPSYVGKERKEKISMIYDLNNIKNLVIHKPYYIIILLLLSYIIYYISFVFNQYWYSAIFALFGMLSIISIIALLLSHAIVLLIKTTDEIPTPWSKIPYVLLFPAYILPRILFLAHPFEYAKTVSLLTMILSVLISIILLLKYKTNKFKTKTDNKPLKKVKDEATRPRKLIER